MPSIFDGTHVKPTLIISSADADGKELELARQQAGEAIDIRIEEDPPQDRMSTEAAGFPFRIETSKVDGALEINKIPLEISDYKRVEMLALGRAIAALQVREVRVRESSALDLAKAWSLALQALGDRELDAEIRLPKGSSGYGRWPVQVSLSIAKDSWDTSRRVDPDHLAAMEARAEGSGNHFHGRFLHGTKNWKELPIFSLLSSYGLTWNPTWAHAHEAIAAESRALSSSKKDPSGVAAALSLLKLSRQESGIMLGSKDASELGPRQWDALASQLTLLAKPNGLHGALAEKTLGILSRQRK